MCKCVASRYNIADKQQENFLDYFIRDYNGEPFLKYNPDKHLTFKRSDMEELRVFVEFAEKAANAWDRKDLTKAELEELWRLRDAVLKRREQVIEEIW